MDTEPLCTEQLEPVTLAIYLSTHDQDLLQWESGCRERGEKPTRIAKEAIRAYLKDEQRHSSEEDISLVQHVVALLSSHEDILRMILARLQGDETGHPLYIHDDTATTGTQIS